MVTLSFEQYACLGYMTMFFINAGIGFAIIAGAIEIVDWWSRRRGGSTKKQIGKKEK